MAQKYSQNGENKNILRTFLGSKLKKLRTTEVGFKNFRRSYKKNVQFFKLFWNAAEKKEWSKRENCKTKSTCEVYTPNATLVKRV